MLVTKENDKIVQFTMLDDNPIWLNAGAAAGPYHGAKFDLPPKANAAVLIGNKVQYVKETPQQVATIIKAKGGKVLPLDRTMFETAVKEIESWVSEPEIWDADLYETGAPGT
ncbi:hypothetical protein [Mesorhizobium sp. M0306]|uniref:hypothetical protein n=1 Tax=unclassified Mesorhizobium TaxID=325217 RepID=UPI003336F033